MSIQIITEFSNHLSTELFRRYVKYRFTAKIAKKEKIT